MERPLVSQRLRLDGLIRPQSQAVSVIQQLLVFNIKPVHFSPSAAAPGDYTALMRTLTLTSSSTISIAISDDVVVEDDEQFTVVLSSSDPNVMTSVMQTTVTIADDDRGVYGLE